jgi:hypothetical protein
MGMMEVREMRMAMHERRVAMPVCMRLAIGIVRPMAVRVMLVMGMRVLVF